MLPPIVLLPAASQFVWFMPGMQTAAFYEFVPLFHSLQYLFIAWAMQISLQVGREGQERSWRAIRAVSMKWGLWNYAGGIALFIGLPWLFFWVPVPTLTVVGVIIAAINIHHFFVDGVIWKLRHASAASPLMTNVTDLAAQPRARVRMTRAVLLWVLLAGPAAAQDAPFTVSRIPFDRSRELPGDRHRRDDALRPGKLLSRRPRGGANPDRLRHVCRPDRRVRAVGAVRRAHLRLSDRGGRPGLPADRAVQADESVRVGATERGQETAAGSFSGRYEDGSGDVAEAPPSIRS